jgi:hypothetical protein
VVQPGLYIALGDRVRERKKKRKKLTNPANNQITPYMLLPEIGIQFSFLFLFFYKADCLISAPVTI